VVEPPFFADDPLEGGDVLPIERPGARTWAEVCQEVDDPALWDWCSDRWLVPRGLHALPERFAETRQALHAVAEHLLAPSRYGANGKIGLRFTYRGFGTPYFGADRQVRVEAGELVDGDRRHRLSSLGPAGRFLGIVPGVPGGLFRPTTPGDLDAPLSVDPWAASALGDWFGFCTRLLEQLRADAAEADQPGRVQLWPEHFDLAVELGGDGARANFGGSPGDDEHPEPYLYVGPWEPRQGPFWNEPFGASLGYRAIVTGADPLAFLREGRQLLLRSVAPR
jgi:hypothetical protein